MPTIIGVHAGLCAVDKLNEQDLQNPDKEDEANSGTLITEHILTTFINPFMAGQDPGLLVHDEAKKQGGQMFIGLQKSMTLKKSAAIKKKKSKY